VQAHGGTIRGENREEAGRLVGARFIITLPQGNPPRDDGADAEVAPAWDAAP
jgi:two-component system, OmpR family, sensor histidine kinase KdpD